MDISAETGNKQLLVRASAIALDDASGVSEALQGRGERQGRVLQLEATAHPTRIDGVTFYNVRRRAGIGYDYTAAGEQPNYILAELDVTQADTLEVRLIWTLDATGDKKGLRARGVKSSSNFDYTIVETPTDRLVAMVRESDSLRFAIGPFRRVSSGLTSTGLETQLSTWPGSTRLLPRLGALARVSKGLAQAGLAEPALQGARLALEIEARAASEPVPLVFDRDQPDWIEAMGLVAQAQSIAGDPGGALATLDGVQKKPGFLPRKATPAHVAALARVGRTPEALVLARSLRDQSRREQALTAIGIVEAERGSVAEALQTVREAGTTKSALQVAEALVQRDDTSGARSVLGLAVELAGDDKEALLSIARRQFEWSELDAARDTARAAAAAPARARGLTGPADAQAADAMDRLSIAELRAEVGDLEGARRTFEPARRTFTGAHSADLVFSLDRVIALQVRLGDQADAQRTLERVIAIGNADAITRAYAASGDIATAVARAKDERASLLYAIARQQRQAGDAIGARKTLKLAFIKRQNEIEAQLHEEQRAQAEGRSTDEYLFAEALERAEQHAWAADPEATTYFFTLAMERARTRNNEQSFIVWREIRVAETQRRTGDLEGARTTWLEAFALARSVPEFDPWAEWYALPRLLTLPAIGRKAPKE